MWLKLAHYHLLCYCRSIPELYYYSGCSVLIAKIFGSNKRLIEDIFLFINMSYVSFVINTSVLLQRVQVQFTNDSQE
jgi:hypothetical protein